MASSDGSARPASGRPRAAGRALYGGLPEPGPPGFAPRLLEFADELRGEGLAVGTSELLDAFQVLGELDPVPRVDGLERTARIAAGLGVERVDVTRPAAQVEHDDGLALAAASIVGAAGLVRYRSRIEDPKDAGVMLSTLAIGLASGVGLWLLASFTTLFVLAVLWMIESFEKASTLSRSAACLIAFALRRTKWRRCSRTGPHHIRAVRKLR